MAIHFDELNQWIQHSQYKTILCCILGIPLFVDGIFCLSCDRAIGVFGDHALHCASEVVGLKFRHDLVRDTFADMCFKEGASTRKQVLMRFPFKEGSDLRPSPFTGRGVCTYTPILVVFNVVTQMIFADLMVMDLVS